MENEEMLQYLEARMHDNPKSLLFARLADLYLEEGKIAEAEELCSEGVKAHPYYTTGYFVLSKAFLRKKEYEKAESALKKVLSHDQQYLAAHKLLGDLLVKTGWEANAAPHYAAVLEIDPSEDRVREALSRIAPKPAPKTALLEPSEDPTAAARADAEALARAEQEPEGDWTDQIREFNPAEPERVEPPKSVTPSSPGPGPQETRPSVTDDLEDDFFKAAAAEMEKAGMDSETAETAFPFVEAVRPSATESMPEPEPAPKPFPIEPAPAAITEPPREKATAPLPETPSEEIIDFTKDFEQLFTFEPESDKPADTRALPPPAQEPPAAAGPSASLTTPKQKTDFHQPPDAKSPVIEKKRPSERAAGLLPQKSKKPEPVSTSDSAPQRLSPPLFEREAPKEIHPAPEEAPEKSKPVVQGVKAEKPKPAPKPAAARPPERPAGREDKAEAKIVTPTLGEIYIAQGQLEKAVEVYEQLLEKNPKEQRYLDKIADLKKKLKEAAGK